MQLHELLTETARRFRDGTYTWAQHAMAYHIPDGDGYAIVRAEPVPVSSPLATCFCGVGGILRTLGETDNSNDLEFHYPMLGAYLARAVGLKPEITENGLKGTPGESHDLMPFINFNDGYYGQFENVTKDDVIAALERAAALATPPCPED